MRAIKNLFVNLGISVLGLILLFIPSTGIYFIILYFNKYPIHLHYLLAIIGLIGIIFMIYAIGYIIGISSIRRIKNRYSYEIEDIKERIKKFRKKHFEDRWEK